MEQGEHLAYLCVKWLGAINPVDGDALAFHAAEPCHLPFGEAPYVGVEVAVHVVVAALTTEILGDVAVFQPVTQQAFFRHPAVEKGFHLLYHAVFKPLAKADAYALDDHGTGKADTDNDMLHVGHVGIGIGVLEAVFLYFEGTEQAVARLGVGVVVELYITSQAGSEFLVGVDLHALAEVGVDRGIGQLVTLHHGFDIHACAPTKDGLAMARHDVVKGVDKVVLELVDVVFVACVVDVNEVIGDVGAVDMVVVEILARAYVHAAEHLPRVGTDNLTAELVSQFGGETCFATSRGACYGEQFSRRGNRVCPAACRIRIRRSRPRRNG